MAELFLSYSRRDRAFVEYLRTALEQARRSVWVDLRDIPPSAAWLDEIHAAITSSDVIVCVLSPDYAGSPICRQEVEFALANNKRIIPIVCRDVRAQDVLPPLAALNWIFARQSDNFAQSMRQLLLALDTDLPYVHSGARLLTRAKEWESKGRNASFTLRGKDLAEAEQWLATSGGKLPPPTQEQTQYIVASRRASASRQRTTIGALTVGILITLALSIISTTLYTITNNQNIILRGHDIAGKANDALANSHLDQGLLLAVSASRQADDFDTRNTLLNSQDSAAYLDTILSGGEAMGKTLNTTYDNVGYTADGFTLMALDKHDNTLSLWDTSAHKLRLRVTIPHQPPLYQGDLSFFDYLNDAAISPDGQYFATKNAITGVRLWSAKTGREVTVVAGANTGDNTSDIPDTNASLKFSPDGRMLAWSECADSLCQTEQIVLWDVAGRQFLDTLPLSGTSEAGLSVTLAFSHDSQTLAAGTFDFIASSKRQLHGEVTLFSLLTGARIERIELGPGQSQTGDVLGLAFSPDNTLLAIAGDQSPDGATGQTLFWNLAQHRFSGPALIDDLGSVSALTFAPDGRYLVTGSGSGQYGLRVWNMDQRVPATPLLKAPTGPISSIAFSADGQHFASGSIDGRLLIWRIAPFTPFSHLIGDGFSGLSQAAVSPDGALLAAGSANTITLWSMQTGAKINTLIIPPAYRNNKDDEIASLAFSPDSKTLASGDELAQIMLWDVATGKPLAAPLLGHQIALPDTIYNFVMDLSFSPDGAMLISSGLDGQAILWRVASRSIIKTFTGLSGAERQAAFSPDGRYLAICGTTADITIWDIASQSTVRTLKTGGIWVRAVAFYPRHVATLAALDANGVITTWNANTGATIGPPRYDGKIANTIATPHIAFNAAGTLLISSHDLSLSLWDVSQIDQARKYARTIVPEYTQLSALLTPDGRYLVVATTGAIEVRYATVADWRAASCAVANRNLTQSEWQSFFPNTPYQAAC